MDWKKLDELKEKMQTVEEFGEAWNFFFDHFGENNEFMNMGHPTKNKLVNKLLKEVLKKVGRQHLNKASVLVSNMLLIEIPKRHFFHGPAMVDNYMASLFYFEDLKMGMISLARLGSGWVHYARFSTLDVTGNKSINLQPGNRTSH
ncbi:MAG TPA: hypothetical protein PLD20_22450 [Blastocatellia bacterium]|nr:hypothetical protein [Blastocatellia bacterium]HMV83182.1 hypothetical protein [Blastocatellia bacterium]HMX28869.1 hypothetical protein [Blastocatellia bacterium]HMZ20714.1 hypothetical protein [Blastocatellia bacterium]HNG31186.1 hypothetical protein [Blastocatellia bacterium]